MMLQKLWQKWADTLSEKGLLVILNSDKNILEKQWDKKNNMHRTLEK